MSNLQDQVMQEQDQFITITQPYNNVDDLFFNLFKVFPLVQVPEEPEALIEFRSKLEDLLNLAEMQDVDVILQDRNQYQSYIIKNLSDFDYGLEFTKTIKNPVTPGLPDVGNFWSIASDPFTVDFNGVYDNILDSIDPRYTAIGDLEPKGQIELPKSNFDSTHHLGGRLRIVDLLSKYGESFPFLNENGLLSKPAREDFEQLLISEATDEELLQFLDRGIDAVKGAGNLVKGGLEKVGDVLGLTDKGRDRKYELERRKREDKERDEERTAKEKEDKDRKKIEKATAKEDLASAKEDLEDVDVEKAAKASVEGNKNDPALIDKNNAMSSASKAIKHAIEAGVNPKDVSKTKQEVSDEFQQIRKDLKSKDSKSKESK